MKGKDFAKAAALLFAGLTAGYLLAQHIGINCCCGGSGDDEWSGDRPPLHVKPVPITKRTETGASSGTSSQGETV